MTKKDFIRKFTTYDQDMRNEYNRGYNDAIRNMSDTQKAQERTAAEGLITTSQSAIDKLVADAVANEAYRQKQAQKVRINSLCEIYQKRLYQIEGECILPIPQGAIDIRERAKGEKEALLGVIKDLKSMI